MKKDNIILKLGLLAGAFILFNSFKNKNDQKKLKGSVYVDQTDVPTGTKQVYSEVGTRVFDKNMNTIYTFDTANLGMTVTGYENGMYSIVLGSNFQQGVPGYVNNEDVQIL
jgi:hypothetical protein